MVTRPYWTAISMVAATVLLLMWVYMWAHEKGFEAGMRQDVTVLLFATSDATGASVQVYRSHADCEHFVQMYRKPPPTFHGVYLRLTCQDEIVAPPASPQPWEQTVATAAAPPTPSPQQVAKFKYEMDQKCASDARAWFKANYSEPAEPLKVQGGGEILTAADVDQNHYSRKLNGCFAVLVITTTFPPPNAQVLLTQAVYDVNENRKIGVLVQKDFRMVTACDVEGTKCTGKAEFETMARDYLVE